MIYLLYVCLIDWKNDLEVGRYVGTVWKRERKKECK